MKQEESHNNGKNGDSEEVDFDYTEEEYGNEELMSIKEVSAALSVSEDTVRRRIRSGELVGIKKRGPYGEQWYIPSSQLGAYTSQQTIQLQKSLSPQQVQGLVKKGIEKGIEDIKEDLRKEMKEEFRTVNKRLEERDEKLLQTIRQLQEQKSLKQEEEKKSIWQRIFS